MSRLGRGPASCWVIFYQFVEGTSTGHWGKAVCVLAIKQVVKPPAVSGIRSFTP